MTFRERFDKEIRLRKLPPKIRFIPEDFPDRFPASFLKLAEVDRPGNVEVVADAFVGRWGTVATKGCLHSSSWDYTKQSRRQQVRHAFDWMRALLFAPRLESAVFVAPHLIFGGSYGDYWLEILCNVSFHNPPAGTRVLLFGSDQVCFARDDFAEKQWEPFLVTGRGVWVNQLSILEPPQYHGNFSGESVRRMRQCFPRRSGVTQSGSASGRKIYISRRGFERGHGSALARRTLANSEEIEQTLLQLQFEIVPAQERTNEELRAILAGASIVVAEHGAAMFHLLWSPPKKIVEIVTPQWFTPCFVKLSAHLATEEHIVLATGCDHKLDPRKLVSVLTS